MTQGAEAAFAELVASLAAHGYVLRHLDEAGAGLAARSVYLRHDVQAGDLDIACGLAELHERLGIPGSFHLAWDVIERHAGLRAAAARFGEFDRRFVRVGLQCDPLSRWLADSRFAGDDSQLTRFVASPEFASYLDELNRAAQRHGKHAPALREMGAGAWQCLIDLDRSFRTAFTMCSSISGRGSALSNAFLRARRQRPDLAAIAGWLSSIDFLMQNDIAHLGYPFEATRFGPDQYPGPTVVFGGAEGGMLREALWSRIAGGGGVVAILPVRYWIGNRYTNLMPAPRPSTPAAAQPASRLRSLQAADVAADRGGTRPDAPFITREADLAALKRLSKAELVAAARCNIGDVADLSFPRFVGWLRSEGYGFDGFDDGPPRFAERRAYLRHDVHVQDLLAAYVLADLHERLGVVGTFQITWRYCGTQEWSEPHFAKLLEFDRRFVRFGLHAAPTASWYLHDIVGCDREISGLADREDFGAWVRELYAAYCRDGDDAPALREMRAGTDDTLSQIATSFRQTFGDWKSISAHGNFLSAGFAKVRERHPEVGVLQSYFNPTMYFAKWGVKQFGFDHEITALGYDPAVPYPRVLMEGVPEEVRRGRYRGRVANGLGFVALFHPATWTCSQNSTFFLPEAGSSLTPEDHQDQARERGWKPPIVRGGSEIRGK